MAIDSLAGMKSGLNKVTKQLQSMQGVLGGRGLVFSMRDMAKTIEKQNAFTKLANIELKKMAIVLPKVNDGLRIASRRLTTLADNLTTAKDAVRAFTKAVSRGASVTPRRTVTPPSAPPAAPTTPGAPTPPAAPGAPATPTTPRNAPVPPNSITGRLIAAVRTRNSTQQLGRAMQLAGFGVLGRIVSALGNAIKIATTPLLRLGAILAAAAPLLLMAGKALIQAGISLAQGGLGYNQSKSEVGKLGSTSRLINQRYNLSYLGSAGDIQGIAEARLAAISAMGQRTNEELISNMSAASVWAKKIYGISTETSTKLMALTTRMNKGSVAAGHNVAALAAAYGEVNDTNVKDLFESMVANTEEMAKNVGKSTNGFIKGAIMAQRMGISMGTVSGLMDKFATDFEGTLEMQGKGSDLRAGVDMSEAIYASNFGTPDQFIKAMNASMAQLGGIDNMSRGMQVTLAKSFGMSVEEMKNFIKSKGESVKDPTPEDIKKATQSTENKMGDLVAGGISGLLKRIAENVATIAGSWIFGGKNVEPPAPSEVKKLGASVGMNGRVQSSMAARAFHTGGLAQNELSAVLKKGEIVLTPSQQKSIGAMINEGMIQRDKLKSNFSQFTGGASGSGLQYALSSMGVDPTLASKSGRQTFAIQSAAKVANKMGAGKLVSNLASKALGATALGSKIGGIIGSIIPGAGSLVGALAGGAIGKGVTAIAKSPVGKAVGKAVSSVGKAIGGLFGKKKKKEDPAPDLSPAQAVASSSGYSTDENGYIYGGGDGGSGSPDVVSKLDEMIGLLKGGGIQAVVYMDGKKVSDSLMAANRG